MVAKPRSYRRRLACQGAINYHKTLVRRRLSFGLSGPRRYEARTWRTMIWQGQTTGFGRPREMPQHRTTSSAWMRGGANTLQAQGLDAAAVFAEVGLFINNLDNPEYRWPTEKASRLWTLAAERSGNPDIGLSNPHVPR